MTDEELEDRRDYIFSECLSLAAKIESLYYRIEMLQQEMSDLTKEKLRRAK